MVSHHLFKEVVDSPHRRKGEREEGFLLLTNANKIPCALPRVGFGEENEKREERQTRESRKRKKRPIAFSLFPRSMDGPPTPGLPHVGCVDLVRRAYAKRGQTFLRVTAG